MNIMICLNQYKSIVFNQSIIIKKKMCLCVHYSDWNHLYILWILTNLYTDILVMMMIFDSFDGFCSLCSIDGSVCVCVCVISHYTIKYVAIDRPVVFFLAFVLFFNLVNTIFIGWLLLASPLTLFNFFLLCHTRWISKFDRLIDKYWILIVFFFSPKNIITVIKMNSNDITTGLLYFKIQLLLK